MLKRLNRLRCRLGWSLRWVQRTVYYKRWGLESRYLTEMGTFNGWCIPQGSWHSNGLMLVFTQHTDGKLLASAVYRCSLVEDQHLYLMRNQWFRSINFTVLAASYGVITASGLLDVWAIQSDALTNGNTGLKIALACHSDGRWANVENV